jgi:enterochelin esterase family protein
MLKIKTVFLFACLLMIGIVFADDTKYQLGPDSKVKSGVPQGTVTQHEWLNSKVFKGTKRRYSVYVPAQYRKGKPAALMVFQDGHAYESLNGHFRVPIVFDNLIHEGAMPPTIAVFIDPGTHDEMPKKRGWEPTPSNRSYEYDSLSSEYATFLTDEILKQVEGQYSITKNPKLRAIGGISSGGICAFTVAWERPELFAKVLSHIGSFVNIRGGHHYAAMIRKTDAKPIRVFLQGGSNDIDNEHGNWPLANQQMAKSLAYKAYDFKFVYGEGTHNGAHGGAILPESLRWLWRAWKEEAL